MMIFLWIEGLMFSCVSSGILASGFKPTASPSQVLLQLSGMRFRIQLQ